MATGGPSGQEAFGAALQDQVKVVASEMEAVAHELNAALARVAPQGAPDQSVARAGEAMHELRSVSAPLENLAAPTRQLESLGRIVTS